MTAPRIGELFAGYGGLGMGVQAVYGGDIAWVSEFDKGANKILAHRFPDVPNHGDITKIDWAAVEPVDILTGGSPCQDLSHAGRRAGMTEGTRSNLWVAMREAIAQLRPSVVIWENVGGAFSAEADSEVEPCAGCVGDGPGVHLRALGRVLGDLSSLGYDASWHALRAADVGAPHGRLRVFVVATDAEHDGSLAHALGRGAGKGAGDGRLLESQGSPVDPRLMLTPTVDDAGNVTRDSGAFQSLTRTVQLLPTPNTGESATGHGRRGGKAGNGRQFGASLDHIAHLLPTPAVNDMGEGKTVERWDEWTADMQAKHGNGNGHGKSLAIEAQRLLPTPTSADAKASGAAGYGGNEFCTLTDATVRGRGYMDRPHDTEHWGDYAAAIARWEHVLGRPAPAPTQTSSKGNPQLSAAFVEWMMGLPAGWVTDVPDITRNEALKALGNGVVPQQAAEALRVMASWSVAA